MRSASFYLIACSLLLAAYAAEDHQYVPSDDTQELDSSGRPVVDSYDQTAIEPNSQTIMESSEFEASDQDYANNNPGSLYDSYSQIPNVQEVTSLAFPASDLNGDNAADLLVMNMSSDAQTKAYNSSISALSGADGRTLWQKEYPGSLVFAMTAGDLNGDGRTDVMIDQVLSETDLSQQSSISAVDGSNGAQIWIHPQMMAMTIAYPIQDINGDDASEILVHTIGTDSINNSVSTRIARVSGASGTTLDERTFSGALAIEYPAGNLTSDQVQDSIVAIYQMSGPLSSEIEEDDIKNITATTFQAVDGKERTKLWEQSFAGPAAAVPLIDLTGDGRDELAVYLIRSGEDASIGNDLAVLQGSDGKILWQKSFDGFMAIGVPGADQTGEGQRDLIIYKLNGSEEAGVMAVKGDDGRQLWSREGMIYIPSDLLSRDLLSFLPASL